MTPVSRCVCVCIHSYVTICVEACSHVAKIPKNAIQLYGNQHFQANGVSSVFLLLKFGTIRVYRLTQNCTLFSTFFKTCIVSFLAMFATNSKLFLRILMNIVQPIFITFSREIIALLLAIYFVHHVTLKMLVKVNIYMNYSTPSAYLQKPFTRDSMTQPIIAKISVNRKGQILTLVKHPSSLKHTYDNNSVGDAYFWHNGSVECQ